MRRSGPAIIVHRGTTACAPENTIAAYASAMDLGADGCEIDLRRTIDGVIVMFHDQGLERMTDAFGRLNQYRYSELEQVNFRNISGASRDTRIPSFAAVLELAKQRAMLLHLDIKEPGLETEIARLLDAADAWDYVVCINDANAGELLNNPKFHALSYKTNGLYEGRFDVDPAKVKEALAQSGNMIILDDPRVAARELGRQSDHERLPVGLIAPIPTNLVPLVDVTKVFSPPSFVREIKERVESNEISIQGLMTAEFPERLDLNGNSAYQRKRTVRICERAWAAQQIAARSKRTPAIVALLEKQAVNRSFHREWPYFGLDGIMATRGLVDLHSVQSAPLLIKTFTAVDPELKHIMKPPGQGPFAWNDLSVKFEILSALGQLRCSESKRFLLDYVAMSEEQVSEFTPPLFDQATRSLLQQDLSATELRALLESKNTTVRGSTILECLDHPSKERTACLRAITPWALQLPRCSK